MKVFNVMEKVVRQEIENNQEYLGLMCGCEYCKEDILAITLNHFKPRYGVNDDLQPYIRAEYEVNQQGKTEILTTILKAAKVVNENPRCPYAKQ